MTGHQPTPSTAETTDGKTLNHIDIAKLLKSLGVEWVGKANPFEPDKMVRVIKQALKRSGFKAIVAEGECALQCERRNRALNIQPEVTYKIDPDLCKKCGICFADFGCTAIVKSQADDGSELCSIDSGLCTQCGACAHVCPTHAIVATTDREVL